MARVRVVSVSRMFVWSGTSACWSLSHVFVARVCMRVFSGSMLYFSWSMHEGVMSGYRMFAAQRKALFWTVCMFSCFLDMVCSGTGVYSSMGLITVLYNLCLCCVLCEYV